jgi:hypothetical protein
MFPSKYFRAAELSAPMRLTIAGVAMVSFDSGEKKPALSFTDHDQKFVLNKTNGTAIAAAFGPDTDAWCGRHVNMLPSTAQLRGKTVPSIKVEPVLPAAVGADTQHGE